MISCQVKGFHTTTKVTTIEKLNVLYGYMRMVEVGFNGKGSTVKEFWFLRNISLTKPFHRKTTASSPMLGSPILQE